MKVAAERLPARVRSLIAATTLLGLVITAAAWVQVARVPMSRGVLAWAAGVAVVVAIGDVVLLQIRLGRHGNGFTWAEASLLVGVAIGGWAWLLALIGPVLLLRQLTAGRPAYKASYNASSSTVAAALAWGTYGAVSGRWNSVPSPLDWRSAVGLALAACVYFVSVSVQVTTAVAWSQGLATTRVWSRGWQLRLVMFAGNSLVGLAAVLVGQWNRSTLVVLPFFLALLYVCYNSALKSKQERDLWQELHAATLSLNRVELPAVLTALQHGAGTLFGSEFTTVLLAEDIGHGSVVAPALLAWGSTLTAPATVDVRTSSPTIVQELQGLGLATAALAPLVGGGPSPGTLLLGFRAPVRLNRRELQMIGTFADQASISLQHAVLFDEIDAQRSRLTVIVDNASDGILLVDAAGTVRAWNPAMTLMTGRTEREAVGAPLESVLPAVMDDGSALSAAQLFAPGQVELCGRIVSTDHAERDVSLALATVQASDSAYSVVVARDITAQRELQQAKEDFIATVSHELRTPLTPIKGYARLLQRPGFCDDPVRRGDALTVLIEQASQLERLVEDLLSVSRMRHGQFDVQPEVADVNEVVARAVRDLRASSGRDVKHTPAPFPATALCDPARLQQVVANLLSNADKYSPAQEPVFVTVRFGGDAVVEVTVADRGSGVPVESREVVFEPFQRLGHHLTRLTRGTGLGLHIARRLVEAMDGRIWVDGRIGDGATFHVTVPRAEAGAVEGNRAGYALAP